MNTKKEIVKFLEELAKGVQAKRDNLEKKIDKRTKEVNNCRYHLCSEDHTLTDTIIKSFKESLEHVEGQLYEINYILETITRDSRKKL